MNIAELIAVIKNESMTDFIPLKDISDEKTRRDYQLLLAPEYYQFPYSYESFQAAYPNLNPDWVYCNKGMSPLYYWEKESDILLKIPVEMEGLYSSSEIEDIVLSEVNHCRERIKEQDYSHVLFTLNGKMKAEYLDYLLSKDTPVKNLYQMFQSVYVSTDFGASVISNENVQKVLHAMTEDEKAELKREKEGLPQMVTIYRGEGSASVGYQNAYSWSLDPNVAVFYAARLSSQSGRIIEAEVNKADILCFGSSADQEVLVFSKDIHVKHIYEQQGINYIKAQEEMYEPLINACSDALMYNEDNGAYDRIHAARMAVLAACIQKLQQKCVEEVKRINGAIWFEDVYRYQNE